MASASNRFSGLDGQTNMDGSNPQQQQPTANAGGSDMFGDDMDWGMPQTTATLENLNLDPDMETGDDVDAPFTGTVRPREVQLKEMPSEFRLKEGANVPFNPYIDTPVGNAQLVHGEYRGIDGARFKEIKATESIAAIVMFNDQLDKDRRPITRGYMAELGADLDEKKKVTVRVSYLTATQFAGVRLHIKRPGRSEVHFKVFGPSVFRSEEDPKQQVFFGLQHVTSAIPDDKLDRQLLKHAQLTQVAKADNLLMNRIRLFRSEEVAAAKGRTRPSFSGITDVELKDILNKFDDPAARETLSAEDELIALFSRSNVFTVFRRVDILTAAKQKNKSSTDKPAQAEETTGPHKFIDYMLALMWLNAWHGALWFYKLQDPKRSLMDADFPIDSMMVPRWLPTTWTGVKDAAGNIDRIPLPSKWSELPAVLEYPDADSCAFLASLGITREAEWNSTSIGRMIDSRADGSLQARFKQSTAMPDQYLVEFFVPAQVKQQGWANLKPATETRLEIRCKDKKLIGKFSGQVMDDIFNDAETTCDFLACVSGREMAFPDSKVDVYVKLIEDPTSTNRALNSIAKLAKGVRRESGVDLAKEIFGAPAKISAGRAQALADSLDPNELSDALARLETDYNLNKDQSEAAKDFIRSCYNLVWGPAGNGKTKTLAAATAVVAKLKIPHIIACASNRAVDKAMEECLNAYPNLQAIRFVGGTRGRSKSPSDAQMMEVDGKDDSTDAEAFDESWEFFIGDLADAKQVAHPDHLHDVVKLGWIKKWADLDGHSQHDNASEYLLLRDSLTTAKGKERKAKRSQMKDLDLDLNKHFLQNCVDVVFVTCSSACHDDLKHFQPKIATMDEAGQSQISDDCMLTAPFMEHILNYNKLGDPAQLGPVVVAEDRNEALATLNKSIFERQLKDKNERWHYHFLSEHYRSDPTITELPNKIFYGGRMINHTSTLNENALQKTLRQFFANLGPAWIGKWRMAIDVSHEGAFSQKYGNTNSLCNDAEADHIVQLIVKMLAFNPVDNSQPGEAIKIQPGDIGVFSPYKGQVRTIARKFRECGIKSSRKMNSPVDTIRFLGTTHGIQGGDVNIGIVSGVVRDPKDANLHTRFTGDAKNLAVNTTRSKSLDIYVGNCGPIVDVLQEQDDAKRGSAQLLQRNMSTFREVMEYLHNEQLIITSSDIQAALLAEHPKVLTFSKFRQLRPNKIEKFRKGKGNATAFSAMGHGAFGTRQKRVHSGQQESNKRRMDSSSWRARQTGMQPPQPPPTAPFGSQPTAHTATPPPQSPFPPNFGYFAAPGQAPVPIRSAPLANTTAFTPPGSFAPPGPTATASRPSRTSTRQAAPSQNAAADLSGLNVKGPTQSKKDKEKADAAAAGMSVTKYRREMARQRAESKLPMSNVQPMPPAPATTSKPAPAPPATEPEVDINMDDDIGTSWADESNAAAAAADPTSNTG